MIAGTFNNYKNYFKSFATNSPDLKFFFFGGVEKGLDYARSFEGFDYPFLWLEQPVIMSKDNEAANNNLAFLSGINILQNAPLDNNEQQEDAYNTTLEIAKTLLKKMREDNRKKDILFDLNSVKIEAISQIWADGAFGWRIELFIELNINNSLY